MLGCDDGRVRVLDAAGELMRTGDAAGRPTCIERVSDAEGNEHVVIGTSAGGASVFAIDP